MAGGSDIKSPCDVCIYKKIVTGISEDYYQDREEEAKPYLDENNNDTRLPLTRLY